eukprot:1188059-Prorocentrum_minimum.AAC.3
MRGHIRGSSRLEVAAARELSVTPGRARGCGGPGTFGHTRGELEVAAAQELSVTPGQARGSRGPGTFGHTR